MSMTRRAALGGTAVLVGATLAAPAFAQAPAAPAPPAAAPTVYFINVKNGDTVASPFKVQFGLTGLGVAPAGMDKEKTGHHHLLVDTTLSAEEMKAAIPVDAKHLHFGGGQTEAMVTLPPGPHTLQLVFANWSHIPFDPPVQSPVIKITVK
jgi:Domain of unknown function (DUF4399)